MLSVVKKTLFVGPMKITSIIGYMNFRYGIATKTKLKIILGAGGQSYKGWISSDKNYFDITNDQHWKKFFEGKKVVNILAEHVLEHIDSDKILTVFKSAYKYMCEGGVFRVAMPDANHPSAYVRELTKPGGSEPGAEDHKIFFSIQMMENIAKEIGFRINKIEYFDNNGFFHSKRWDDKNGHIERCSKNYKGRFTQNPNEMKKLIDTTPLELKDQFKTHNISYTSLLIDFKK